MNPDRAKALGSFLKDHRSALGLSTRALAARCNVDMATIVRLENGAFADPRPETLRAVRRFAPLQTGSGSAPPRC